MTNEKLEEIPMNAVRVCDAISKIGYQTYAAIEDIIDNSISAKANKVKIEFNKVEGKTLAKNDNIEHIKIIDNGIGMDHEKIKKALMLGSNVEYQDNSLSKYGMGLKSAGFSLGDRIEVVSKKDGILSEKYFIDKDIIRRENKYMIGTEVLTEEESSLYNKILNESGTIIKITKCNRVKNDSINKTLDKLRERLGVVYYEFLNYSRPLNIELEVLGLSLEKKYEIVPNDLLFINKAKDNFSPDIYDFFNPYIGLKKKELYLDGCSNPIFLEVVFFPQDQMKSCVKLEENQREQIKDYKINQKNKGFFIYRNGRLIRWGDTLELLSREDVTFRARLSFDTNHDELLHVDVSKQNLNIPEDVLQKIEEMIALPLRNSRIAYQLCSKFSKESKNNGNSFNYKNQYLDLDENDEESDFSSPEDKEETKKREKELIDSNERKKKEHYKDEEDELKIGDGEDKEIFQKIRYSDQIIGNKLWDNGFHPDHGSYVRINTHHTYYNLVILHLLGDDSIKQSIEILFYVLAATENELITKYKDLNQEQITKFFDEIKRRMTNKIDNWSLQNQDLFENGK